VLAPAATDGRSGLLRHFAAGYPHHMWTAGADWLLVPLLDYVDATGDERFLRDRVLPALTELALFYEDFLAWSGGLAPSYSPENHPAGWTGAAVNATMDVAAARHALAAAAAVCARLGTEQGPGEGIERWRARLGRLPAYRINGDGALAEWAWPPDGPPLGDHYDHRHVSHLYPVWPLHDVTVDDTPGLARAALRALRLRGTADGSAHGYVHRALAAARLRDAGRAGRELAAVTGRGFFFRSLMSSHYPGRRVYNADAACGLPAVLTEMLADSVPPRGGRPGRVELLPAVPGYLPTGRLRGAATLTQVGLDLAWDLAAGLVQAELRSRISQPIELTCRAAVTCHATTTCRPAATCRATTDPVRLAVTTLRPGRWRLELPADVPVHLTLEG
jgi:alpha-L-fucosidase 2